MQEALTKFIEFMGALIFVTGCLFVVIRVIKGFAAEAKEDKS